MKIKRFILIQSQPALLNLLKEKFVITTTLKLMKISRIVKPELIDYEKLKNEMIIKYGEKDGENTIVKPERMAEFSKEIYPALDEEIEIDIEKLPLSLITVDISPEDLEMLEWMIDLET